MKPIATGVVLAVLALGAGDAESLSAIHRSVIEARGALGLRGMPVGLREQLASVCADIHRNTGQVRSQLERLDKLAAALDGADVSSAVDDPVASVRVDQAIGLVGSGPSPVGSGSERATLASLLRSRARELSRSDRALSQRYHRAWLALTLADWFNGGPSLALLSSGSLGGKSTIEELTGLDPRVSAELQKRCDAIDLATKEAFATFGRGSLEIDKAIRAADRSELTDALLDREIESVSDLCKQSANRYDLSAWMSANLAWRLRSAVALHAKTEQLKRVEDAIKALSDSTPSQPARRWLHEAATAQPREVEGSGVHVITDPNDPSVKGTPP
jgi:hypothetical protein